MAYTKFNIPAEGIKSIEMDNQKSSFESLFERVRSYIDTRIELVKLKTIDKTSSVLSMIITFLVVFIVFALFFLFFNIGLALLIGDLVGRSYYGFFILGAIYAVAGIILLKFRNKWVKAPLINMMVKGLHE